MRRKLMDLKSGRPLGVAAQDTHVKVVQRIFDKGKNAQNGPIGQYNTSNPLYVNPRYSPKKFAPRGKNGESKFKNGKTKKTRHFKSYSDYRQAIGRQVAFVNFKLSGTLQSDFGKGVQRINSLRYASGVRINNEKKIKGLENKYGNVFRLTPKERTNFKQVLAFESVTILK